MRKKTNTQEIFLYILIVIVSLVLIWTLSNSFSKQATASPTSFSSSECGNLNDMSNIQHLSHHPDIFSECIKQVEPEKFLQAVGIPKDQYLKQNNI